MAAKIQQIMPADGWRELTPYRDDAGEIVLDTIPVMAFALTDENVVEPVTGDDWPPAYGEIYASNFCGLVPPGVDPEEFRAEAERFVKHEEEREAVRAARAKE